MILGYAPGRFSSASALLVGSLVGGCLSASSALAKCLPERAGKLCHKKKGTAFQVVSNARRPSSCTVPPSTSAFTHQQLCSISDKSNSCPRFERRRHPTLFTDMTDPGSEIEEWWRRARIDNDLEQEFCGDMKKQTASEASRGRAMVITTEDMPADKERLVHSDPEKLKEELDKKKNVSKGGMLVILEDMGREFVEELGSCFDIPPDVFALHWARPEHHVLGQARLPVGEIPQRHFALHYRQYLPFRLRESNSSEFDCTPLSLGSMLDFLPKGGTDTVQGWTYRLDCGALRTIVTKDRSTGR